jgi:hypothetical protein
MIQTVYTTPNSCKNMDSPYGIAFGILASATLFEIASAISTPLSLDESTKSRAFGHYGVTNMLLI